jgi:hypothetical protein
MCKKSRKMLTRSGSSSCSIYSSTWEDILTNACLWPHSPEMESTTGVGTQNVFSQKNAGAGDVAQWQNACLPCMRPRCERVHTCAKRFLGPLVTNPLFHYGSHPGCLTTTPEKQQTLRCRVHKIHFSHTHSMNCLPLPTPRGPEPANRGEAHVLKLTRRRGPGLRSTLWHVLL